MNFGRSSILTLLGAALLGGLAGCGGGNARFDTGPVMEPDEGLNSMEYWASKGFETQDNPPGALPDVTAELGGAGFEEIAASLGFQTNTEVKSMTDPRGVPGGVLRLPLEEYPATLRSEGKDSNTAFMFMVGGMMYERLMGSDPWNDAFAPSLASHWKIENSPDGGQVFTFRINPNARWQTGHRVTADDIKATWRIMVDEGLLQPYNVILYQQYTEPEALSPYLVRTTTKEMNWRHFMYFGAMNIYPNHIIGKLTGKEYMERFQNQTMPGSGLYLLKDEDTKQGVSIAMSRINNYWDKDNPNSKGGSNFAKVKFRVVADETLQREMFKKGELDVYMVGQAKYWVKEFLPEQIEQLGKGWIQRKKVYTQKPNGVSGFVFNMREEPFNDIRVRKAFAYLLNREKLIDKLFYNEYLPMHSYYAGSVYENQENEKIKYDPDTGHRLLAEAGYAQRDAEGFLTNARGQRLEMDLMIDESPTWERVMTVIQEDYKQAGIKINLKPTTGPTKFQMVMDRKFKMHFQSWGGLYYPNPENVFKSNLADVTNTNNLAGYKSEEFDALCEAYNKSFDQAERISIIRKTDKLLTESFQYALGWYGPFTRVGHWNKFGMPEWVMARAGGSDWRSSIISLWWYDADKHKNLIKAIKQDESIPLQPVEIDYWKGYDPAKTAR